MEKQQKLMIVALVGLVVAGGAIAFVATRQKAAAPETGESIKVTPESVRDAMKNNNAFGR